MKIYNFDSETGEFLSAGVADTDPLDKAGWLIPAYATSVKPPAEQENEVAIFDGDSWYIEPDFRGKTVYRTTTKEAVVMEEIGSISRGLTIHQPQKYDYWDGSSWVADTALEHKENTSAFNAMVDLGAGRARSRFVSDGEGILFEYRRAYDQATDFKSAGYSGEPPSSVADNMRYKNLSAQSAADDIIAEGDLLNLVLDQIRSVRLDGKAAIKTAVEGDDLQAIAQPFLDQLAAIKPA